MPNNFLTTLIYIIVFLFWGLLLNYLFSTVMGIIYRLESSSNIKNNSLVFYPSVSVLIPAYNEGKVLGETLYAMSLLDYPGKLDIFLLDDSSTDNTAEIAKFYEDAYSFIHYVKVPPGYPKGKSRVLNYGSTLNNSEYICVFDADNRPQPDSLKLLVEASEKEENSCGSVGYVKQFNFYKNILTRMISLEFSMFQLLMQCGRWKIYKLGVYTGTNMIVRRSALEKVGFWDVNAIAEDLDLSMSLTAMGYVCPVVPDAITYEQEPQTLGVFIRQRTRWMSGNLFTIKKALKKKEWKKGRVLHQTVQLLSVYIFFVLLLFISHAFFFAGLFSGVKITGAFVPILYLWYFSWLGYFIILLSSQFVDGYISFGNTIISFIMYLTYSQFWIIFFVKSMLQSLFKKKDKVKGVVWDKTTRY